MAQRLCSALVDPVGLRALLACRLIAQDKNPGIYPIGICEVMRRQWCDMLTTLSLISVTHLQAAYAAYTHGFSNLWTFLCRTMSNTSVFMQPLEDILRRKLIPSLTGREAPGDLERRLLALPVRLGGLGLTVPTDHKDEFEHSMSITSALVDLIHSQSQELPNRAFDDQLLAKSLVKNRRPSKQSAGSSELCSELPPGPQHAMSLAQEKGASSWLSILPILEHGFTCIKYCVLYRSLTNV